MHYYQFNIGDYVTSTQHLEPMEDLAYRRMLDLYYQKEQPLPLDNEKIAKLIRMRSHCDCIAFVLSEYFTKEKDGYHNAGADKNLTALYTKSAKAKASAEARWAKARLIKELEECERNANACETQCLDDAVGMLPITQDLLPNNSLPITKDSLSDSVESAKKSKFKFSDEDMKLVDWMIPLIENVSPTFKCKNPESWANTIRLMRESDKLDHKHIAQVFKWANQDKFWKTNIMSASKLREQFSSLDARRLACGEKPQNPNDISNINYDEEM